MTQAKKKGMKQETILNLISCKIFKNLDDLSVLAVG